MGNECPVVLTIAGSDSGGGAGIQADLKTFAAYGCFGTSAITAVTAQNTVGVQHVEVLQADFVAKQITSVVSDFKVRAIKIGMLATANIIDHVSDVLEPIAEQIPIVVDPVMVATSGDALLDSEAVEALTQRLFPLSTVITPNMPEAAKLLATEEARDVAEMSDQAVALLSLDCGAALVKGGHLPESEAMVDVLATTDGVTNFDTRRLGKKPIHGTGCTLSSAIAAELALGGGLSSAVRGAQAFVHSGIATTLELLERCGSEALGQGSVPIHHALVKPQLGVD